MQTYASWTVPYPSYVSKINADLAKGTESNILFNLFGSVRHYHWFLKGFAKMTQPLHERLSGEGASKKREQVTLTEKVQGAFAMLRKACSEAPVLAFAGFRSHSSWKLMPASLD